MLNTHNLNNNRHRSAYVRELNRDLGMHTNPMPAQMWEHLGAFVKYGTPDATYTVAWLFGVSFLIGESASNYVYRVSICVGAIVLRCD